MAERARAARVNLRPHAKTHKVPEIGRMQLALGASGLSLAKVGEAEVFAEAGFEDVFLAYPTVGGARARRLLALSDRVRISAGADSVEGARDALGGIRRRAPEDPDAPEDRLRLSPGRRRAGPRPRGRARDRRSSGNRARRHLHARRTGLRRRDCGRRRRRGAPRGRDRGGRGGGAARRRTAVRAKSPSDRRRRPRRRCGRPASPSAGRATTSTTTPHRSRSARARRRTAR